MQGKHRAAAPGNDGHSSKQIDRLVIEQEDNRGIEDKAQRVFDPSILFRWRGAK
jgi:hypothetical protein